MGCRKEKTGGSSKGERRLWGAGWGTQSVLWEVMVVTCGYRVFSTLCSLLRQEELQVAHCPPFLHWP